MPRFFIDYNPEVGGAAIIEGGDARHIAGALRMTAGESLTLCDGKGTDYACTITAVEKERVTLSVDAATPTTAEPTLAVTLYMGLPKGDKMELIIQKCVELGITAIVPVAMSRCIVKLDGKDAAKKQARWQKIADEAAGQSGRGILPTVEAPITWKQALSRFVVENTLLCYEGGGAPIGTLVSPADTAVSLVVGPEGGFDPAEVEAVTAVGGRIATLGPRILRCETAPIAALAVLMEKSGNMA
ncbi:MAG: 16S rRNA (uracil(1498)-N(3))-methyltransferase [Clostridia bacterium]|nr:16S rRNA (uracil(1498)-N(3))-methyltransferase [Clostridia bacterium]